MRRPWWLLTLAAGVLVMVGARGASAQTVIVRNAGLAPSVELTLNGNRIAPGAPVAGGDATFSLDIISTLNKQQTDVHLFVDRCGAQHRIFVEEAGRQASGAPGACARKSIPDLFVIQSITTLVVDLAGDNATALIRQGPAPPEWLGLVAPSTHTWTPGPKGLVVSGAVGLGWFTKMLATVCGTAPECNNSGKKVLSAASASYWLTDHIAADAGFIRPAQINVSGSGANYQFTTVADIRILTLGGRAGGQAGPVKLSVLGGTTYTGSTFTTTQTVTQSETTTSGTQTFAYQTRGWGWFAGGSIESWLTRWVALYGEGGLIAAKGTDDPNTAEGALDDSLTYVMVGIRVHVGR